MHLLVKKSCIHVTLMVENSDSENHTTFEYCFLENIEKHTKVFNIAFYRILENHTSFEYTDDLVTRLLENPHKFQIPRVVFFLPRLLSDILQKFWISRVFFSNMIIQKFTQVLNRYQGCFFSCDYWKFYTSYEYQGFSF